MELKAAVGERLEGAPIDRAASIALAIGLAVLTWLDLLLLVGFLARLGQLSVLNVLPVFFVGLLFWPVYRAAPWLPGLTDRVRAWARGRTTVFAAIVGLALLPLVPPAPDLLVSLLQLPYRGSGIFFGATLFYRDHLGDLAARVLLRAAQWTIQLLWLYLLATGLVSVVRRVR